MLHYDHPNRTILGETEAFVELLASPAETPPLGSLAFGTKCCRDRFPEGLKGFDRYYRCSMVS